MGAGGLLELRGCRLRRKFVILLDRKFEDVRIERMERKRFGRRRRKVGAARVPC